MAQLTCNNLTIGYDGKTVLKGLDFSVNSGDYLCIVGENGSGKSTLMKTILHLLAPLEGSIAIENRQQPGGIGYLPQQTVVQRDFPASVWEIVLSGCLNRCGLRPYYSREEKQLSRENMEKMGISHLSKRCYRELSGGQQQRVLLARALCAAGKMLLLDEPVSGLDPKATAEMYELIRKLNEEGISIIMISHDIGAALSYASHILHMGDPLFFGTKDEYLNSSIGKAYSSQNGGKEA
ncbi:metal ABC transporter ATP-binding protein [Lacrimispora sp.]|uniref:metal ABC transporter ATP-binding protein n=1 Tax=Lacrimispora sp. TaxID=2719234 RepID=UPI0028ACAC4E|nr:ABC transporter ATP-binding protein [Lacrimispora sp.]